MKKSCENCIQNRKGTIICFRCYRKSNWKPDYKIKVTDVINNVNTNEKR
jgi:hypothetical protein